MAEDCVHLISFCKSGRGWYTILFLSSVNNFLYFICAIWSWTWYTLALCCKQFTSLGTGWKVHSIHVWFLWTTKSSVLIAWANASSASASWCHRNVSELFISFSWRWFCRGWWLSHHKFTVVEMIKFGFLSLIEILEGKLCFRRFSHTFKFCEIIKSYSWCLRIVTRSFETNCFTNSTKFNCLTANLWRVLDIFTWCWRLVFICWTYLCKSPTFAYCGSWTFWFNINRRPFKIVVTNSRCS